MQIRLGLSALIVFGLLATSSAFVWSAKAAPKNPAQRVELVPDQEHGVLRVVIDDREIAWFDATGLYVRGDIAYKGTITDGLPLKGAGAGAR